MRFLHVFFFPPAFVISLWIYNLLVLVNIALYMKGIRFLCSTSCVHYYICKWNQRCSRDNYDLLDHFACKGIYNRTNLRSKIVSFFRIETANTFLNFSLQVCMNCKLCTCWGYILAHLIREECWNSFSQRVSVSYFVHIFQNSWGDAQCTRKLKVL